MAYAAVISVDQTIHHLLNSRDRISISSTSRKKLKMAHKLVKSLKEVLMSLDGSSALDDSYIGQVLDDAFTTRLERFVDAHRRSSESLTALDGQIRDALHSFEDLLDSILSLSKTQTPNRGPSSTFLSLDLDKHKVWKEIKKFTKTAKKLKEEFDTELDRLILNGDGDAAEVVGSSYIDFGVEMVGNSNHFKEIKDQILRKLRPSDFGVFSILGVLGTGRTAAARATFEYLTTQVSGKYFDCGAWVKVGPNFQIKEIIATIIAQIDESWSNDLNDDTRTISEDLYERLKNRRYMIVIDDIRNECIWDELRSSFPDEENGSVVMVTTGIREVALCANSLHIFEMCVYDEKESWGILEQGIFGERLCPLELLEAGKRIAKNCGGRRIALAKAILLLAKAERKAKLWNEVAEDAHNPIFMVVDELSEICKIENDNLQLSKSLSDDQRETTSTTVNEMVVLPGFKEAIIAKLFPITCFPKLGIIYMLGMAGVGKTKLAKKLFEDHDIIGQFDNHVWLTLGPKYKSERILADILAKLSPDIDIDNVSLERYPILAKRWLIVLDDVWDDSIFYHFEVSFPNIRGRVLVTTRQGELLYNYGDMPNVMYLLNEEESWSLFCKKVFSSGPCPRELEEAGKKIAKNCEGLPLLILTVANALLEVGDMTLEHWKIVAKDKKNFLFLDAYEKISPVLYPSYEYLPQYMRPCFLYMGAFPQNYEISTSKLIKLLSVEGLLEPNPGETIEKRAISCVLELNEQNLIMICDEGTSVHAKSYHLHSSFWYLSNSIAEKSEFLHVLDSRAINDSRDCKKNQRRLCIRSNIVLIITEVRNMIESISYARSFLCFGQFNQYPLPIYLCLRLLRVLDALTIRLYEFPIEVVELIHLRYLALTCDESLPSSISKLWFLQFLIINQYLNIRSSRNSLHLPVEIWDMKELRHIHVPGSILLDPASDDTCLPNLTTLSDVSVHSCTEKILSRMPNLKKLGIQIELTPRDDGEDFRCSNLKSILLNLESLNYVVVNPKFRSEVVAPSIHISMFPLSLTKLKLSGLGYPWEYMSIVGELKNLRVLKLQSYAFCGPQWNTENGGFIKLEFLLIEDSDVVYWNVKRRSFPALENLTLKHCYKLKELPYHLSNSMVLIDVVDCNPLVDKWARQMEKKETKNVIGSRTIGIEIHSSWEK